MPSPKDRPSSILILGSGEFGLTTALSLAQNHDYDNVKITLVDRSDFPAPDGSSIDSSRIVRADYTDISYTRLTLDAQDKWRNSWWGQGSYHEDGLALAVSGDANHTSDSSDWATRTQGWLRESMENQQTIGLKEGPGGELEGFETRAGFGALFKQVDGSTGADNPKFPADVGYINRRSGWADAEKTMRAAREKLDTLGKVGYVTGQVDHLLFDNSPSGSIVRGAVLTNGTSLTADVTILATGAWTPSLIDMRGIASATGQTMGYIDISDDEQAVFGRNPTILSPSSGMFIITPSNNKLKVARHGYGYANRVTIRNPTPRRPGNEKGQSSNEEDKITVSLPLTSWDHDAISNDDPKSQHGAALDPSSPVPRAAAVPPEAIKEFRDFLRGTYPAVADRPFTSTRICWYLDTASSDFIIDWHPEYEGLFVATGGSGHAFKFAPVLGDAIVKRLQGKEVGYGLDSKWNWPREKRGEADGHVWAEQIRGGRLGMELRDEFAKGQS